MREKNFEHTSKRRKKYNRNHQNSAHISIMEIYERKLKKKKNCLKVYPNEQWKL